MPRPLAAITGASSGIGAVFARMLAHRGYDLLLIARRQDRLASLAATLPGSHQTLSADLSTPEGIAAAAGRLTAEPHLQLLVNNAGFGTKGRFYEAPFEDQQRMHRLHIDATLSLTRAVLPGMVARDEGAIINVSSVAAYSRSPGNVSYCATKAWINAFTEGVYLELKNAKSRVIVQALCPGFTYSEFHDVMGIDRAAVPKPLWLSTDKVVAASLDALASRRLFVIPGWFYRIYVWFMPRIPTAFRLLLEAASPQSRNRV